MQQAKRAREVRAPTLPTPAASQAPLGTSPSALAPSWLNSGVGATAEWISPCSEIEFEVGVTDREADWEPANSWPISEMPWLATPPEPVNGLRQRFGACMYTLAMAFSGGLT